MGTSCRYDDGDNVDADDDEEEDDDDEDEDDGYDDAAAKSSICNLNLEQNLATMPCSQDAFVFAVTSSVFNQLDSKIARWVGECSCAFPEAVSCRPSARRIRAKLIIVLPSPAEFVQSL